MLNSTIRSLLIVLLPLVSLHTIAQRIDFYAPLDSGRNFYNYQLAGKVGENILLLNTSADHLPEILLCDSLGKLIVRKDLPVAQLSALANVNYFIEGDHCTVIIQHQQNTVSYLGIIRLDKMGELLQPYTLLDSVKTDRSDNKANFQFLSNPVQKEVLLYRLTELAGNNKLNIDYFIISPSAEKVKKETRGLTFSPLKEDHTPVHFSKSGEVLIGIYDKGFTSVKGWKLTLYQFLPASQEIVTRIINYKDIKPVRPFFIRGTSEKEVQIASLFKSANPNRYGGFTITSVDMTKRNAEPVTNTIPFSEKTMRQFYSGKKGARGTKKWQDNELLVQDGFWSEKDKSLLLFIENNKYRLAPVSDKSVSVPAIRNESDDIVRVNNNTPSMQFDAIRYEELLKTRLTPSQYFSYSVSVNLRDDSYKPPVSSGIESSGQEESSGERIIIQEQYLFQQEGEETAIKGKIGVKFLANQLPFKKIVFNNLNEPVQLGYSYWLKGLFLFQSMDSSKNTSNVLVSYPEENWPFYKDYVCEAGERKLFTFYVTGKGNCIGLAAITW